MDVNFHGKRVLVVEDNYLIAAELADHLAAANAIVVGPCATLADAEKLAVRSDLAVLDVDLKGEMVFPLADRLRDLDVPYVFFTGYDRGLLPARFAKVGCITKPLSPLVAVQHLEIRARSIGGSAVRDLIPMLRQQARYFLTDAAAADRLVELTLRRALEEAAPAPFGAETGPWLLEIMQTIVLSGRGRFFN